MIPVLFMMLIDRAVAYEGPPDGQAPGLWSRFLGTLNHWITGEDDTERR